jgi:hypothetical protein
MKTLYTLALCSIAVIAGCSSTPTKPVQALATKPVVIHDTVVRYVVIDPALTQPEPVPAPVVPGVTPWGVVLAGYQACAASVGALNARAQGVANVQGSNAAPPSGPSTQP